jgi:hypothetical protein
LGLREGVEVVEDFKGVDGKRSAGAGGEEEGKPIEVDDCESTVNSLLQQSSLDVGSLS